MNVLIVGGGEVALRRMRALDGFGVRMRAVAPEFIGGFEGQVECVRRSFKESDLDGVDMAIAATSDGAVNAQVARLCRERKIEVNAADAPELSTFQFPAVVRRGRLTIAVNTGGAAPVVSRYVRGQLERVLPDNLDGILDCMEAARTMAKAILPDQRLRAAALRAVFDRCLESRALPEPSEVEGMIRRFLCTEMD